MTTLAHLLRRTAVVLLAGALVLVAAGPAGADTPEGWPVSDPVDPVGALLLLGGIPLLIILVVAFLVFVPGRSRRAAVGHPVEDHWFGGPRQGVAELPAAEPGEQGTGGTSARW